MKTYSNVFDRYNTKSKVYPSGLVKVTYCNTSIFVSPDKKIPMSNVTSVRNKRFKLSSESVNQRSDSVRRSKEKLFDIVYCNDWDYFVTVTYDPKKVDSYNAADVMRTTSKWLSKLVSTNDLHYLLIPEYHKSGRIHCHCLFKGDFVGQLRLIDSGKVDRFGKTIYNLPGWQNGWSTAIPIDGSPIRLSCYVTKYITKNSKRIFGKYYWSSQNLVREPETYFSNMPYHDLQLPEYRIEKAGLLFKYESFDSSE